MRSDAFGLDISLASHIARGSADFQAFLNDYFLVPMRYMRGEHDETVLDRLSDDERATAIQMVAVNLRSQRSHLIDATARLHMTAAIPALREMLSAPRGAYEHYRIARALHILGDMMAPEFYQSCTQLLERCTDFTASTLLHESYEFFSLEEAKSITDLALHREDYSIRASGFITAAAISYIRAHGGKYSRAMGHELWRRERASATVGAPEPHFYEQLQYYVGDAVFADQALFETRLAELWQMDPKNRHMPLFTEIEYDN